MDEIVEMARRAAEAAFTPRAALGLWEIRTASTRLRGRRDRTAIDGGCRVEWAGARGGRPAPSVFVVGCSPSWLPSLASGAAPAEADEAGWSALVLAAGRDADRRLDEVTAVLPLVAEGLVAGGLVPAALRSEVHTRVRSWWRGAEPPRAELAVGFRIRGVWAGRGRRGNLDLVGRTPHELAEAARSFAPDPLERPAVGSAPVSRAVGPLALSGAAAAWWAHEMAHAVLEGAVSSDLGRGITVRDDPQRAPWPFGYGWDDAGYASADLPAVEGHLRRASVRDPARPLPAVTWLDGNESLDRLPDGILLARRVDGGRFDPPTRTVILQLADLVRFDAGQPRRVPGTATATVPLDTIAVALVRTGRTPVKRFEPATCMRQGSSFAVMVGAPTIILDPVRVNP